MLWNPFFLLDGGSGRTGHEGDHKSWMEFPVTGKPRDGGGVPQAKPAGSSWGAPSPPSRPEAPVRQKPPIRSPRQTEDGCESSETSAFRPLKESPASTSEGCGELHPKTDRRIFRNFVIVRSMAESFGSGWSVRNSIIGRTQVPSRKESPVLGGCIISKSKAP